MKILSILITLVLLLPLITGCNSGDQPLTPGKYVGSVNSNIYHYPSCVWARRINPENEIWFDSVADAKMHGYRPCKVCKPPSNPANNPDYEIQFAELREELDALNARLTDLEEKVVGFSYESAFIPSHFLAYQQSFEARLKVLEDKLGIGAYQPSYMPPRKPNP